MDDELTAIIERAAAAAAEQGGGPAWPTPQPVEGQSPEQWATHVQRLRRQHDALALEGARRFGSPRADAEPVGSVGYVDIPAGDDFVAGRVYRPATDGPHPVVLFFHGGAFWMGGGSAGFELNDAACRALVAQLDAVVVNVDYRLAPEHPYPTQLEDGYAALEWVAKHGAELDADTDRIGVLGISSGGNLAATLSHLTRDRGGPRIAGQVLWSPALDLTASAWEGQADPMFFETVIALRNLYARDVSDWTIPYLSPMLAGDLSGLPPAVIVTGEFDPLRPDGLTYGERLREQGVPAQNLDYPMTHTAATPEVAARLMAEVLAGAMRLLS